ncbi:M23 family metallopeptidase [Thaumasiovibrio sp. DFM-14]|uniref:M23 family metallopeptidase n=1 Tax=Thaumasiovibrio sp. DFM-14 TaxID=3384792 RepID=UPI0039A21407
MEGIVIKSPLKGQWAIINAPGHPELAFDFLAVDDRKNPYPALLLLPHIFVSIPVTSVFAWDQPVFSPFSGEVVDCYDGENDRQKISLLKDLITSLVKRHPSGSMFNKFGGNYIVLKSEDGGFFALLAHLKSGSVMVNKGDMVTEGQFLGAVGNSGTSIQPHLHFQLMKVAEPFPYAENLLNFSIEQFKIKRNGAWDTMHISAIRNGDHLYL